MARVGFAQNSRHSGSYSSPITPASRGPGFLDAKATVRRETGGRAVPCASGDLTCDGGLVTFRRMKTPKLRIGVDLGGTKIEAVGLRDDGSEIVRHRVATP